MADEDNVRINVPPRNGGDTGLPGTGGDGDGGTDNSGGDGGTPTDVKIFSFTISSNPNNVKIFVNGTDIGRNTPYKITYNSDNLSIPKEITVSRDGYIFEETYIISQGSTVSNNGTSVQSVTIERIVNGDTTITEGGLQSEFTLEFKGNITTSVSIENPNVKICEYRITPIGNNRNAIIVYTAENGISRPLTVRGTETIYARENSVEIEQGNVDISLISCGGTTSDPKGSITITSTDNITKNSFDFRGEISTKDISIQQSAIVYSTTSNINDASDNNQIPLPTQGTFNGTITGLSPNRTYYVRAYLNTNIGLIWSNEVELNTLSPSAPPPPPQLNELIVNITGPNNSLNSLSLFDDTYGEQIGLKVGRNEYSFQETRDFVLKSLDVNRFRISKIEVESETTNKTINAEVGRSLSYTFKLESSTTLNVTVDSVILVKVPRISLTSSDSIKYNINNNTKLFADLRIFEKTDSLTVYINNRNFNVDIRNRPQETNYTLTIDPKEYFTSLGNYKVTIIPFNSDGAGQNVEFSVNVFSTFEISTPDLRNIKYPSKLRGPDFVGFDVNFNINWVGVNTTYVNLYYGNSTTKYRKVTNNNITLNVKEVIDTIRGDSALVEYTDRIDFFLRLIPFNESGGEVLRGREEIVRISFDKRFLTIPRNVAIERIFEGFEFQLETATDVFRDETSNFLTHILHLGGGSAKIISNWVGDSTDNSVILKLYEPLPTEVQLNQKVWISKLQSNPIVEVITLVSDGIIECQPLKGPNFSVDIDTGIGMKNYEALIASGSLTSQNLINRFTQKNNIDLNDLNIQYVSDDEYLFYNFSHFGSATEIVNNFVYKLKLTEEYNSKIDNLKSGNNWLTTLSLRNDIEKTEILKNEIIKNFTGFEYFLYEDTSLLSYPKSNSVLYHTTSSEAITWYNSLIVSSSEYDKYNSNYLVNNMPEYIIKDSENSDFILFLDMIGTHFDIIWSYINGVTRLKKLNESKLKGITDKLVFHMLESLGWNTKRPYDTYLLWEYAFGKNKDGSSKFGTPLEDATSEVWRRILNNLPYLLKHKGTARSLKAIMSCYGIPQSLLTIMEFGGPQDPTLGGTKKFTFDDRTAALVFQTGSQIDIGWNEYSGTSDYPNGIEFRIDTTDKTQQTILQNSGNWSLVLTPTTSSFGKLEFYISGSDTLHSSSTTPFALFTDDYEQILINRTVDGSGELFEVYGVNTEGDRITETVSSSLYISSSTDWVSGSNITIGTSYSGKLDEFRLWSIPLQVARLQEHALFPDSISGNSFTASTADLLFRLDFERPQDLNLNPNINNVSINRLYGEDNGITSNFYTATDYPYQYFPYERTVTATVPSLGFNYSDKIRFETQYTMNGTEITADMSEVVDLSHLSRATQRQFDRAPVDSSRLGIFFSPIKELNMDILKTFGDFNIDNLIGNPADEYSDRYRELDELRGYYFQRLNRNLNEYIQLVRYIDKSLFDVLSDLAPARAKVSKGLLIEPHFLERSKIQWKRPTAQQNGYIAGINVEDLVVTEGKFESRLYVIDANRDIVFDVGIQNITALIRQVDNTNLTTTLPFYDGLISYTLDGNILVTIPTYEARILFEFGASLTSEYENTSLTVFGFEPDSVAELGYGIFAPNGVGLITRYDRFGKLDRNRKQVFVITENKPIFVPEISGLDTILVKKNRFKHKVTLIPIGDDVPSVAGSTVNVQTVNGYLPTHYKFVNGLTAGLRNSFFNGAKQTINTTTDGLSPVETFTTNPNILRVTDTGRGSGEPILVID